LIVTYLAAGTPSDPSTTLTDLFPSLGGPLAIIGALLALAGYTIREWKSVRRDGLEEAKRRAAAAELEARQERERRLAAEAEHEAEILRLEEEREKQIKRLEDKLDAQATEHSEQVDRLRTELMGKFDRQATQHQQTLDNYRNANKQKDELHQAELDNIRKEVLEWQHKAFGYQQQVIAAGGTPKDPGPLNSNNV
jgi:hypothetical protein